jgi:lipopolysaccharide transport system ATP-binding protein
MSNVAISVEGLGKRYQIGTGPKEPYGSLRDSLTRAAKAPINRLRRGDRSDSAARDYWALKDVSFEIKHGEAVGIIGRNGAGKSTLLKVLSRITEPTTGQAIVNGRVGSLLEVGTGFHPELTGRENIYLNGAVMGMSRADIQRRFDEIVDFSGVETYLETPVKRYSSGMYMRLAFAVAAHLEPEVLVIDEVLAVGDVEFQKKCLGKIGDVTRSGRTVLFVSHQMQAISSLCGRSVVLEDGRTAYEGATREAISYYLDSHTASTQIELLDRHDRKGDAQIRLTRAWLEDSHGNAVDTVYSGQDVRFVFEYKAPSRPALSSVTLDLGIDHSMSGRFTTLLSQTTGNVWKDAPHSGRLVCELPRLPLNTGQYTITACARVSGSVADWIIDALSFDVVAGDFFGTGRLPSHDQGAILLDQKWSLECLPAQ